MSDLPLPVSPFTVPNSSFHWLSVSAAARLLGRTDRHVRRLCGDKWFPANKARMEGGDWKISADADPAFFAPEPTAQATLSIIDFRQFPQKARDIALARSAMLDRWTKYLAASQVMNDSRDDGTDRFLHSLQAEDAKRRERGERPMIAVPGRSTLYVWAQRFKDEGIVGLVPGHARREKEGEIAKGEDPFFEALKVYWLDQRRRSVKTCYEMAMGEARRLNWEFRSYDAAKRFLRAIPPETVSLRRHGQKHFEDHHEPYLNGDYSPLQSNEIWNADHHRCDVLVKIGEKLDVSTGEARPIYARPWLTAWQDLRSRKIVGWLIRVEDPNTAAIVEALDRGFESHGKPQCAYTDNGKDFDAWELTGVTKAMRWKRRKLHVRHDQEKLGGLYAAFKIKHLHAWIEHGQSKPIERFFGRMEDQFGKLWATYCGRNPQEKPEDLPQQLARGNAPTLEEFIQGFGDWLEMCYHAEAHRGDAMEELAPAVVWEQNLRTKETAEKELRLLLMQPRVGTGKRNRDTGVEIPLTVGQNGVPYKGVWYGQYDLAGHHGKKVYLRIDRSDLSRVAVYLTDASGGGDTFLCYASSNLGVPKNANHADLSAAIAEKVSVTRTMKAAARMRPRLHEDLVDIMRRAARQRQALAAKPETPPPAPNYKPVRSDLESQLPAIREAYEMKKAVGDDTPRPRFQYGSLTSGEGDSSSGSRFVYHGRSEGDAP